MIDLLLLYRLSLGFWAANHRPYWKRQMLLQIYVESKLPIPFR